MKFNSYNEFYDAVRDLAKLIADNGDQASAEQLLGTLWGSTFGEILGGIRVCLREVKSKEVYKLVHVRKRINEILSVLDKFFQDMEA